MGTTKFASTDYVFVIVSDILYTVIVTQRY
jgi:hypothetical protein